ncbi:MAG: M48 family metalloprotease [Bacteroidetes bacterium]|uniref:M48 family metalloprotease n=1 Tax=Candidatus Cryptobacteroides gallistercoris TaxID=2840765 RepID=A0A940DMA1_9BACT|nr:M48 family metalloprotease [Candidatus Cryptobacteroides gallistercoris]
MTDRSLAIPLEQELGKQIYAALQGQVVEAIIRSATDSTANDYWRSRMEGHCMKVEQALLPDFHRLCMEVKERLGFTEPVDFYVTGDSTLNAFSVASDVEGQPHIINVNSSMFDLMSEDEMRFVIGHELGHIINKDTALKRLIYFVFPPETTQPPVTLQYKIRLHDQLAELVADRYGYLANGNLNACVTAFFKMASGLDLGKMNVSIDTLLADNSKRLDYFLRDRGLSRYEHPVNPIRVQALRLFSSAENEEELAAGMDELIGILLKVGNGPIDEDLSVFFASTGLVVASADGSVTSQEVEHIIDTLSNLQIFPRNFLDSVAGADVVSLFNQSLSNILSKEPGMRDNLLLYMISLVLSDKEISDAEVRLIYNIGSNMGYSDKEISVKFAEMIQRNYIPSLSSIC